MRTSSRSWCHQETVVSLVCVDVKSRASPPVVDRPGVGTLVGRCTCAGRLESRYGAAGGAHESVIPIVHVDIVSGPNSRLIDALADRALVVDRARSGGLETCY